MGSYIIRKDGRNLKFDVTISTTYEGVVQVTDHPVESGVNTVDHARKEPDRVTLEVFVSNAPIHSDLRDGAEATVSLDIAGYKPQGRQASVDLKVAKWEAPLEPTPGAVFNKVQGFVEGIFSPERKYKAIVPGPDFIQAKKLSALALQFDKPFDVIAETVGALDSMQGTGELVTVVTDARDFENMLLEHYTAPRDASTGDGLRLTLEFRQARIVETKVVSAPVKEPKAAARKDKGAQAGQSAEDQKQSILRKLLGLAS
jgi:hypothetical protein